MTQYQKAARGAKLKTADLDRVAKLLADRGIKGIAPEVAASRWVRHRATDERPDYAGDIVRAKGANLSRWLENAQIFLNHNSHDLGQKVGHGLTGEKVLDGDRAVYLEYFVLTSEQAGGNPLPDTLWKMMQQGLVSDGSIGFLVESRDGIRDPKPEERAALGMDPYRGVEFTKWTLTEFSVVTIGCNSGAKVEALAKALRAGVFTDRDREAVRGSAADELLALFDHAEYKAAPSHSIQAPDLSALRREIVAEVRRALPGPVIPAGHILVPQSAFDELARKTLALVETFDQIQPATLSGTPAETAPTKPAKESDEPRGNTSRDGGSDDAANPTQE